MRSFFTLTLGAAVVLAAASMGCGGGGGSSNAGGGGDGTGGDTGGTMSTTTPTTTTPTTTTPTTTSMDCTDLLPDPNDCGLCVQDQCCTELLDCFADAECNGCLTDPNADPNACAANAQFVAVNDCASTTCADACAAPGGTCARYCCDDGDCGTGTCDKTPLGLPDVGVCLDANMSAACDAPAMSPSMGMCGAAYDCNPITNEPCDTANGEACDFNGSGFQCFGPPNDVAICGECNNQGGPFCQPGHTCAGGPAM